MKRPEEKPRSTRDTRRRVSIGGSRELLPVARRPNDGVLFPTYPPLYVGKEYGNDVKSLACGMNHHSFRVTSRRWCTRVGGRALARGCARMCVYPRERRNDAGPLSL